MNIQIFYGTNRRHQGDDRWHPTGYGTDFSSDGSENLRFGTVSLTVADDVVQARLAEVVPDLGVGNGEDLSTTLADIANTASIAAFPEALDAQVPDSAQPKSQLGSAALFAELKAKMDAGADVLVYIHGFNTSWASAVGGAAALQIMLNNWSTQTAPPEKEIVVFLFSWPSEGLALPWTSYRSDRTNAEASGNAIGRGFLKFRDFLADLHFQVRQGTATACGSKVHLLCHSMGNYVLQNALARLASFSPGATMPRILESAFLCAADVDDDVLEPGEPLGRIDEVCDQVSVYFNHDDRALAISDWTKGNPDRLGARGPAHRSQLHAKVETIDCTSTVQGAIQHSYYLNGACNRDIWQSITDVDPYSSNRNRQIMPDGGFVLKKT